MGKHSLRQKQPASRGEDRRALLYSHDPRLYAALAAGKTPLIQTRDKQVYRVEPSGAFRKVQQAPQETKG